MPPAKHDPSVFGESQFRPGPSRPDPSEAKADRTLARQPAMDAAADAKVELTVWDEPGISADLAGQVPEGDVTYVRWLRERTGQVTAGRSWLVTAVLALAAGPWAMTGALMGSGQTGGSMLVIVCFGPIVEEVMKVSAALYVVEKRPFLFRTRAQIIICAAAAGLVFACIENLLYLNLYIRDPSPALVKWRWTICVFMHVGCSVIAGMGVARIWRDVWQRWDRPRLPLGFGYTLAAIILHGSYNAFAVFLSATDYRF